jgi:hypothetical protein
MNFLMDEEFQQFYSFEAANLFPEITLTLHV